MKKRRTALSVFALLLACAPVASHRAAQNTRSMAAPLKQITLTFELQDLPGRNEAGSFWEVSYQWRIASQADFDQWANAGEDPVKQKSLGILLSKQVFTRKNLAAPEQRRFTTSVPVRGELHRRLLHAGQRPQIVWLDATVRIHDTKLGTDVIKKVNPVWGPYFYREGIANLRLELTQDGRLRWYTGDTPPWGIDKQGGVSGFRIPRP